MVYLEGYMGVATEKGIKVTAADYNNQGGSMKIVVTDTCVYTFDTVSNATDPDKDSPEYIREFQRKRKACIEKQMCKYKTWDREAYAIAKDIITSKRLDILEV